MITLNISAGAILTGVAVIGVAAYALYRVGKKQIENQGSPLADKYIERNPSTPQAKDAFISNLSTFMPYFRGSSDITIDKEGLTDAIIRINDKDLIALWYRMINRPELWINQMAAWGVAPDARMEFVAMEKHAAQYSTREGGVLQIGVRYSVLSACWLQTITDERGVSIKNVVKKGIVEEKQ